MPVCLLLSESQLAKCCLVFMQISCSRKATLDNVRAAQAFTQQLRQSQPVHAHRTPGFLKFPQAEIAQFLLQAVNQPEERIFALELIALCRVPDYAA